MNRIFDEDEAIAWPSYVDFLFAFTFILILSLGYMAFLFVHGIEREDFQRDATNGRVLLDNLGFKPMIDTDRQQIIIPLGKKVTFQKDCPSEKPQREPCPTDLNADQKEVLRDLFQTITKKLSVQTIFLRGQTDTTKGADEFTNVRLGNSRALLVYEYLFHCGEACGFTSENRMMDKVELANAAQRYAVAQGASEEDRTVTVILDYAAR